MDIAILVAEAMDMVEEISTCMDMAGVISEAIIIINTSNITLMMNTKQLNNMALLAPCVVATTTPPSIVTRESMILIT